MQILWFTSLLCLKTTALVFVQHACHHYQSLNCSSHYGDISDEVEERAPLCQYWALLEWTGLSVCLIYMYVDNPVLPLAFSSSRQLPSSATRIVKRRLWWLITSGLCFAFWNPKHPTATPYCCHCLPLLASPAPFLYQSQALRSQTLEHDFIIHTCGT